MSPDSVTLAVPHTQARRHAAPPFPLQIGPDEAFAHAAWQRARAACLGALRRGEDAVLLGAAGFGKTLLLQEIAAALRAEGRSAHLFEPAAPTAGASGLLLVDEADALPDPVLVPLLAAHRPVLLAALPGAAERLSALGRPLQPVTLAPLAVEDVARFIAARLAAAGLPRDRVAPDAVLALARWSGGAMRLVVGLANAALFLAEQDAAGQVQARHVEEAAALRGLAAPAMPAGAPEAAAPEGVPATTEAVGPAGAPGGPEVVGEAGAPDGPEVVGPAGAPGGPEAVGPAPTPPIRAVAGPLAGPPARTPRPGRKKAGRGLAVLAAALLLGIGWAATRPTPAPHATGAPAPLVPAEAPADARAPEPQPAPAPARELPRPPPRVPLPWIMEAAPPGTAESAVTFRGPVVNETLDRSGQLAITVLRQAEPGAVRLRFQASGGLLGTGELGGTLSPSGEISASGRLMMGRNPHDCVLTARLSGDRLTGSASFRRPGRGGETHSSFILGRN